MINYINAFIFKEILREIDSTLTEEDLDNIIEEVSDIDSKLTEEGLDITNEEISYIDSTLTKEELNKRTKAVRMVARDNM